MFDKDSYRVTDGRALRIFRKQLAINHKVAGKGLVFMRQMHAREMIEYFHGFFNYLDFCYLKHVKKSCREWLMAVSVKQLSNWKVKISSLAVVGKDVLCATYTVQVLRKLVRYTRELAFCSGDKLFTSWKENIWKRIWCGLYRNFVLNDS